jgi:hypothetical protein
MNRISLESKDATDEQRNLIDGLRKDGYSNSDILKMLIDNYMTKQDRKTGIRQSTLDKIDPVVKAQMQLNATTDKIIKVGSGQNEVEVKYEQRAITAKWIMGEAKCNQSSALEYIKLHEDEINTHHHDVLGTDDTDFFNRRVGRAAGKVTS